MPAGGSRQSAPAESQAKVLDASSGILPWADAPVLIAKVKSAATGRSVLRTHVKVDVVPSISSGFAPPQIPKQAVVVARVLCSEIRLLGARDRKQVMPEVILVVLGAHRFHQRVGYLPPTLHQVQRLVERVGVGDLDDHFQRLAVVDRLEPL